MRPRSLRDCLAVALIRTTLWMGVAAGILWLQEGVVVATSP